MARPGGILCYDLSSSVGWAYGHPADNVPPLFGEILLRTLDGGEGARFVAFENECADQVSVFKPMHLCTEAPLPLPAMNNRGSALQQIGLRALAVGEAYRGSCRYHETDVGEVRRTVLGTSRMQGEAKKIVTRWCWSKGIKVQSHNMADAVVLWHYYRGILHCN